MRKKCIPVMDGKECTKAQRWEMSDNVLRAAFRTIVLTSVPRMDWSGGRFEPERHRNNSPGARG